MTADNTWLQLNLKFELYDNFALPNTWLRSSIFSSRQYRGADRPTYTPKHPELQASYGAVTIYQCTGSQLDGTDLDVLGECIRLASELPAPKGKLPKAVEVTFSEVAFLRAIKMDTGGKGRLLLADSLDRLKDATYTIDIIGTKGAAKRRTSFVYDLKRTKLNNGRVEYSVLLNVEIAASMYQGWSLIKTDERFALRMDLARWLHGFYSTHSAPVPLLSDTLKKLAKRETMREREWIPALKKALEQLQAVTQWPVCELVEQGPNAGKVIVRKFVKAKALPAKAAKYSAPVDSDMAREKAAAALDLLSGKASVKSAPGTLYNGEGEALDL